MAENSFQTNSFGRDSQSAAGHQGIMNDFNKGQKTKYLNETIWKHRCESIIPQISDQSWFGKLDNINCQNEMLYKLQPTGIVISSMDSYNQELKSHAPTQTTQKMKFGEWIYSQTKFSKMELNEKCDKESYMRDIEEEFRRRLDDYIEKLALARMACVSPCWNKDVCEILGTGSQSNPRLLTVENSHTLPIQLDELEKSTCQNRGYFLTFPRCEKSVLTQNKVIADLQKYNTDQSQMSMFTGNIPKMGDTSIILSKNVPYTECADGSRVYALTHAPVGSFGYASILSDSETVNSSSMETHWGVIHRIIVRFGMLIPIPWDYTTIYVKIKREQIEYDTCD